MKLFTKRFWRLFEFCLAAALTYFVGKVPLMYVLTDILEIHYIISGAFSGAFVTLLQFFYSELKIWKGKADDTDNNRDAV